MICEIRTLTIEIGISKFYDKRKFKLIGYQKIVLENCVYRTLSFFNRACIYLNIEQQENKK